MRQANGGEPVSKPGRRSSCQADIQHQACELAVRDPVYTSAPAGEMSGNVYVVGQHVCKRCHVARLRMRCKVVLWSSSDVLPKDLARSTGTEICQVKLFLLFEHISESLLLP